MRTANLNLKTPSARARLTPRTRPYFTSVAPCRLLGYVRSRAGAGTWCVQLELERDAAGTPRRVRRFLAGADDAGVTADAKGTLSFSQAFRAAAAYVLDEGAGSAALTVAQACEAYVAGIRAGRGDDAAQDARGRLANHVIPVLGARPIARLTLTELQSWRDSLIPAGVDDAKRRARCDTVNRVMANFKAALNHAFRDPAHAIPSDKAWRALQAFKDVGRAREHHFTEAETIALIAAARDLAAASRVDDSFAALLEAAAWTGARYGELAACEVRHLDAKHGMLHVPDGKTGARDIAISSGALTFFKALVAGRARGEPLLKRADGARWGSSHQQRPMSLALAAAGLDTKASFYALRHSYISRAVENGMPVTIIAENCGTSVRMIERNYQHLFARKRSEWIERGAPSFTVIQGGRSAA